tara:strand:- start:2342 stop:5005 length:2664 start_codon:yes stop_codon:yes gene_type:complete
MGGDIVQVAISAAIVLFSGGTVYAAMAVAALTYASIKLAPKPKIPDLEPFGSLAESDRKQSFRQAITTRKLVYGKIRVGGPIIFLESTDEGTTKNQFLHMIVLVASHEINSFQEYYIDGNKILPSQLDGNGNVNDSSTPYYDGTTSFLRIEKAVGTTLQGANANLISESNGLWTANHKLSGIAYVYLRFRFNRDIFQGIPQFACVIEGKKVYDTRTGSTAYSQNPALILRDYMTDSKGMNMSSTKIDDSTVTTAANICDEDQELSGGGTEKRYTADGMIDTGVNPRQNINDILSSMGGVITYSNGKFKFFASSTSTAVFSLNEDDVIGDLTTQARLSRKDNFNSIKGKFLSETTEWEQTDYPALSPTSFITEDNGEVIYRDLDLAFTTSQSMAQRLAKIQLYQARQPLTVSGTFKCSAFALDTNDLVKISNTRYGWSNKVFRVASWGFTNNQDGLSVTMTLTEYADSIYSWSTTEQQVLASAPNTTLPSAFSILPPTNLQAVENLVVARDNSRLASSLDISFTGSVDARATSNEVQYKLSSSSTYISAGTSPSTEISVLDLSAGVYDVRVRAISAIGIASEFSSTSVSLSGLSAPPANMTGLSSQPTAGLNFLTWNKSTDLDVTLGGGVEIRFSPVTSGATWNNSTLVDDTIAGDSTSVVVPLRAGTYLAKFFDSSGHFCATASTNVTTAATVLAFQNTVTVTESTSFSGTKTNLVVSDNKLQLNSSTTLDQVADFDGIADFNFLGGLNTSGTYFFANQIDKGSVTRVRLQANATVNIVNTNSFFDQRTANIDTWNSFDNTGDAAVADLKVFYAESSDGVFGSFDAVTDNIDTWADFDTITNEYIDFKEFQSVEANNRYFKFKAELSTEDPAYNIRCSALSVTSNTL